MNLLSLCFRHNQRNLPPPPPPPPPAPPPAKHCLLLVACLCVPPRGVFECGRSDPGSVRSSTCCVNGRFTTEQTTRVCFTLFFFFFHAAVRTFEKHCGVANECFARAVCRAGVSGEQLPVSCCPSLSFVAAGLAGVSVLYILVHTDGIKTFQLTMVKLP